MMLQPLTSPEEQAGFATFVAEKMPGYADRDRALQLGLGHLVMQPVAPDGMVPKIDHVSVPLTSDEQGTAIAQTDFADFLRLKGSDYEPIKGRADILGAYYDRFRPMVVALKRGLEDPEAREYHPAYLAEGTMSKIYTVERDDQSYVVRIPDAVLQPSPSLVNDHLGGAVLVRGVPHFEQIVAASYEDGVTVAEKLPGVGLGQIDLDGIKAISDEQLSTLVDTLSIADNRGVRLDFAPDNFLYDHTKGFGLIDYTSWKEAHGIHAQELPELIGGMASILNRMGPVFERSTSEERERALGYDEAKLAVLERYRTIVETKLSGDELTTALGLVDLDRKHAEDTMASHSPDDWLEQQPWA
jgi:hypothetical protein